MSSETPDPDGAVLRPLGYDLRLVGPRADAYRQRIHLNWRPELLPASYDSNVAPPMFVAGPQADAREDFQHALDDRLVSDSYFPTFGLFRSDREAVSFIEDRDTARDFELWRFSLIQPDHPPQGIFAGILGAMAGETIPPPDFPADRIGYEVLDGDGASVTHTWTDPGDAARIDPLHPRDTANLLARQGLWLVAIDRLRHPWWLRE